MKQRVLAILKWLWVAAVAMMVVIYLGRYYHQVAAQLSEHHLINFVWSVLALVGAKLLLALAARYSLSRMHMPELPYARMFCYTAISQLNKFMPGGVWHFVGRFQYYRKEGVEAGPAGRAMLLENIWLLVSASLVGILFLGPSWVLSRPELAWVFHEFRVDWWDWGILILVVWTVLFKVTEKIAFAKTEARPVFTFYAMGIQLLIWLLVGVGFWQLFPPEQLQWSMFPLAVGTFTMGWVCGSLMPFAPSGLGVREAVMIWMLSPVMSPAEAIVCAGLSRLVWTSVEVILGGSSYCWLATRPASPMPLSAETV